MIFELLLVAAVVVAIVKMAGADGRGSPAAWGGIAFVVCMVSLVIPLPFARVMLAGIGVFVAMIAYNMMQASKPDKGAKITRNKRR